MFSVFQLQLTAIMTTTHLFKLFTSEGSKQAGVKALVLLDLMEDSHWTHPIKT